MGEKLPFNLTIATRMVLTVLLADPDREVYGLQLVRATGLPSGTIHPILNRLAAAGYLNARSEDVDPAAVGRPARRYVQLTPSKVGQVREAISGRGPVLQSSLPTPPSHK